MAPKKTAQPISTKEALAMITEYENTRVEPLKKALGFEDTRSNWFNLEELKAYITSIEKQAKRKGISVSGINFISAAYPDDSAYGIQRKYQTLVLAPTTLVDGKNVNFNPASSTNKKPTLFDKELKFSPENTEFQLREATPPPGDNDEGEGGFANRSHSIPPFQS